MRQKLFYFILAVAASAAALIACTREPETQPKVYDQETEYEVVLTASLGPDTRGVSVTSDAVTVTWSPDDKVALVYNNKILTALEVTGISGNTAQLSGKVYGAYPTNTEMTLYYGGVSDDFTGISYDYSGQDGTAASAAARAYLQANVKIAKQENKKLTLGDATTGGAITLAHQQAYYELKFQYGPEVLKVRSVEVTGSTGIVKTRELTANGFGGNNYAGNADDHFTVTTTAAEGLGTVYFVFSDITTPPTSDGFDYVFKITDVDGNPYTAEWKLNDNNVAVKLDLDKRGPAVNGAYRSGTWVLDRQTLDPTKPQAQSVVYDAQPHELVTPGSLPYGNGTAEGAKMLYYVAPVKPVGAAVDTTNWSQGVTDAMWSETVPTATAPGQYCIWYKVVGGRLFNDIPPTPVVSYSAASAATAKNAALIDKRSLSVTPPTGITNLKYTGSAQALINPGTIKDKTSEEFDPGIVMKYIVTDAASPKPDSLATGWSTEVPTRTNAGTYYVWHKADSTCHYYGSPVTGPITVTIATTDAVIANPEPIVNLIYNGEYQQLVLPADASDGCKVYYFDTTAVMTRAAVVALPSNKWVEATPGVGPKRKNAGTYYIWTKVEDKSGGDNFTGIPVDGVCAAPVVVSVAKAAITMTDAPAMNTAWTAYDGEEHPLVDPDHPGTFTYAGVDNTDPLSATEEYPAVLYYKLLVNNAEWSTESPVRTNSGHYAVVYKVEGGRNFHSVAEANVGNMTVAKATPQVTPPEARTGLVYDGNEQALVTAGSSTFPQLHYAVSTTDAAPEASSDKWKTSVPTATDHGTYYVFTRVVSSNSNVNSVDPPEHGIPVTIAKATGTLTVSSPSQTFTASEGVGRTKTLSVSWDGDGTVSVQPMGPGVSATKTSNQITITRIKPVGRLDQVSVSVAGCSNYETPNPVVVTVTLTANPSFSVGTNKKVAFSQGNLQYYGSSTPAYWTFAAMQYQYLGTHTNQNSSNSDVTRDLFGWGTSGYDGKYPYMTSANSEDYYSGTSISGTEYDWGKHNAISGGGDQAGLWRTLTAAEWYYLLFTRTGNCYVKAILNNVNGLLIFPDGASNVTGISDSYINQPGTAFQSIPLNAANTIAAQGFVFLPAAGFRTGTNLSSDGNAGRYWTTDRGRFAWFDQGGVGVEGVGDADMRVRGGMLRPPGD